MNQVSQRRPLNSAKRFAFASVGLTVIAMTLQACGQSPVQFGTQGASSQPSLASQLPLNSPQAQPAAISTNAYLAAADFKAVARVDGGFVGSGQGERSLINAEREALRSCTRRSNFQGDCKVTRVGEQSIVDLDAEAEERVRWAYLRTVHERQAVTAPVQLRVPVKALVPGSKVVDGSLFLSGNFVTGGYSIVQFGERTCSGALDPIEREDESDEPDLERPPVGIMEFACDNGLVLRGGYVKADKSNQIFFLEDRENERWDFIASTRNDRVGNELTAFKGLYRAIERGE